MINAQDLLYRCQDMAHKERVKERRLRAAALIGLVAISSFSAIAAKLHKPAAPMPQPCNMSEYYLAELEDKDEQRVLAIKKLKEAQAQIRRLKQERGVVIQPPSKTPQILDSERFGLPSFETKQIDAFDYAVKLTLRHEGGYGIDNNGYPVNYGINQAFYKPLRGYPKHVKQLTKRQAIKYYQINYWEPLQLADKAYSVAYKALIFDTAVNKGLGTALKINRKAKGSIVKAKLLRLAHLQAWAKSGKVGNCGKRCIASLQNRIHSFKETV